ncbi:EpsB [Lachnospiraceae bacterium TWA4]|nr:EpsB [Lachnospiraceae bacterium TWA4]
MNRRELSLWDVTLYGIWQEIKKDLLVILLMGISAFLMMTAVGKLTYTPIYQSTATVAISIKGSSGSSSLSTANSMAEVFSNIFSSDVLQRKVREKTEQGISGNISCSMVPETNLITLTSSANDPREAYLYLEMALKSYNEVSDHIFSNSALDVIEEPTLPMAPSNISIFIRYRFLASVLVVILCIGVSILQYVLRYTVKTVEGAKQKLDGTILGVTHIEKKKKKDKDVPITITNPLVSRDFTEQIRMIAFRIEKRMKEHGFKTLLINSVIEHEGKSTYSIGVATALAEKGKKVVLIDGDFLRPTLIEVLPKKNEDYCSLSDVLDGVTSWKDAVCTDSKSQIQVLLQEHAVKKPQDYAKVDRLKPLIDSISKDVDYVIVDTSPVSVSADAEIWMQTVDTAILVVRQDWSDIRAINDAVDLIWQNCEDFTGFVLNAFAESGIRGIGKGASYE